MSLAATHASDVAIRPVAVPRTTVEPVDGSALPHPSHAPVGSVIAFALAGPGAFTAAAFLSYGLMAIGRGGSTTLWSTAMLLVFATWLPATLVALWAASARGEWG